MGGYPIAIQSYLRYSLRDGRIMRREAYRSTHLRRPGSSLRLIPTVIPLVEPRASSLRTMIAGQWYSGHAALGGGMEVYPGVYREACIPGCIYLPCT